jgi:hypothetical protein
MNKNRFLSGLIMIALGLILSLPELAQSDRRFSSSASVKITFYVMLFLGAGFVLIGLGFSIWEFAGSVVKRLRNARKREKAIRNRQRQARQNKERSASS